MHKPYALANSNHTSAEGMSARRRVFGLSLASSLIAGVRRKSTPCIILVSGDGE